MGERLADSTISPLLSCVFKVFGVSVPLIVVVLVIVRRSNRIHTDQQWKREQGACRFLGKAIATATRCGSLKVSRMLSRSCT